MYVAYTSPVHDMFMMKHEGVSVLLIVGLVTASKLSSGLSCCNTYVVHTEATYNQTVHGDNCVCYSTLSKLTKLESNTEKDVEVIFQPGACYTHCESFCFG